jgi:hypothetical protein
MLKLNGQATSCFQKEFLVIEPSLKIIRIILIRRIISKELALSKIKKFKRKKLI